MQADSLGLIHACLSFPIISSGLYVFFAMLLPPKTSLTLSMCLVSF